MRRSWIAMAIAILLGVAIYVPIVPQSLEQEPDLSFRATNADAFARHLRYGRDIVSTYGPWGILQRGYDARTDAAVLAASALLALAFAVNGLRVLRDAEMTALAASFWLLCAAAIVQAAGGDIRFTVMALLLVVSLLEPYSDARELPIVAALGLVALVKFSFLMLAVFLVVMSCAHRRRVRHLAIFALALSAFWLAAGQRPLDFVPFVKGGLAVSSGYAAASVTGGGAVYAIIATIGLTAIAFLGERDLVMTAIIAGFSCYLLKMGFVRADVGHTAPANAALLLTAASYLFVARRRLPGSPRRVAWLAASATLLGALAGMPSLADHVRETLVTDRATALATARQGLFDRSAASSLPEVAGTIDAYPWGSAAIIARGLTYAPRPVFQSCMAWTTELAEWNAAHIRKTPPDWIWAGVGSIDNRLPMLDDGPSWLEIARRYDVAQSSGEHLLLQRRPVPRKQERLGTQTFRARLGESVRLPAADSIWCTIELEPGFMDRAMSAIVRPNVLMLETIDEAGHRASFRVAAPQLRGGFLVSPEVLETGQLANLIKSGSGNRITQVRLTGSGYGDFYRLTAVTLSRWNED